MTKYFATIFIALLTGCNLTPTCDLSSLKVKSVALEGDPDGVVAAAIERELYARGAESDQSGIAIVGKVRLGTTGTPLGAKVRTEKSHFAGLGTSTGISPEYNSGEIARQIARDFCRCADSRTNQPKK